MPSKCANKTSLHRRKRRPAATRLYLSLRFITRAAAWLAGWLAGTSSKHTHTHPHTPTPTHTHTHTHTLAVVVVVDPPFVVPAEGTPPGDGGAGLGPGAPVRRPVVLVKLQQLDAVAYLHLKRREE